ncbi:MAG: hypothetical protein PHH09_04880 [Methanoregulaceae archaeon]|nr:hypothetical protein [Methanoregulaceae archaeon]
MKSLVFGEKRYISIKLSQKSGSFAISGATYEIRKEDRIEVLDTGECGVDDTTKTVWMLFDTMATDEGEPVYTVGDTLYVYFWVTITDTSKIVNGTVRVEIVR